MLPKNLQNLVIIFKKNTECIIRFQILFEGAKIMKKFILKLFFEFYCLRFNRNFQWTPINIIINICKITKKHQNFLI